MNTKNVLPLFNEMRRRYMMSMVEVLKVLIDGNEGQ